MSGGPRSDRPLHRPAALVVHLENTMSAIEDCRIALLGYLAPFRLDAAVINRLEVILEELLSNVVRHSAEATAITVQADYYDGTVNLSVEDDGVAFDPLQVREAARFTTLEKAKVGGLGIPLIRRLTQSVRYERVETGETGCNRITAVIAAR